MILIGPFESTGRPAFCARLNLILAAAYVADFGHLGAFVAIDLTHPAAAPFALSTNRIQVKGSRRGTR